MLRLCIEMAASLEHIDIFVQGCAHVLRKGGRILLADAMERKMLGWWGNQVPSRLIWRFFQCF